MISRRCLRALLACLALDAAVALADAPRVLPAGQLPKDARLELLKDLDGYFPFTPPATKEEWDARAERIRRRVLSSRRAG